MSRPVRWLCALAALAVVGASCTPIQLAAPLSPLPDGAAPVAPAPPLEEAWVRNVDGALGSSAPVVTQDVLAFGTRRGDVVLVTAEGALEGSASFGDSVEGGVVLAPDGRRLFVPLAKGRHGAVAHDLVAGRRLWEADLTPVVATPALVGPTLVVVALDGTLSGLDPESGATQWTERPDTTATFRAAPLGIAGDVVVADDRGRVERRDAATGAVRWSVRVGAPVYHDLALTERHVVLATTRGALLALDTATGAEAWRLDLGAVRVGAPLAVGGAVVVGASSGDVVAVEAASGRERWRTRLEGVVSARPAAGPDVVFVGTQARGLTALDLATGRTVWSTRVRGRIKTALAVAGDLLVVASEPRHLIAFRTAP